MEKKAEVQKDTQKDAPVKKGGLYEKITLITLAVCLIALPVFVIPSFGIGFFFAKFGLVTLAVLIGIISLVLQVLNERSVERYSLGLNIALFALPVVYIVSSLFTAHPGLSLMGSGADLDTAYLVFLGTALAYLVSRSFRTKKSVLAMSLAFLLVSFVVSIFHILRFIFGVDFLSAGMFSTISSNTIGGFNELGIYSGLSVIIAVIGLELLAPKKSLKLSLYVSLIASLAMVTVTNFSVLNSVFGTSVSLSLSFFVALFALVIFIHKKVAQPKSSLPTAALVTLLISLVLTIANGPISEFVAPKIGLTQQEVLDVRVSPGTTADIALSTYGEGITSSLLGVGPNNFFMAWAKHKPVDGAGSINLTDFWNIDFNLGSGYIPTAFVTTGILGGLAWIFFLIMLLYYVAKLLKHTARSEKDQLSVYASWIVSAGTVYLWAMAVFFTAGPVILFIAFMFTGLLLGTLVREDVIQTKMISWDVTKYWKGFALTFSMILLIIACMYLGYVWQQRLAASMQVQAASQILQKNNAAVTEAQQKLLKAINIYFDTSTLRLASDVSLIRPTALIAQAGGVVTADKLNNDVVTDINFSITAARHAAVDLGVSSDYRDWLQLGKAYETATFLGATSTANLAVQSYLQAEALNPTSPVPPFLIGRLYALARGFDVASQKLQRAIDLKPNYTDAIDLLNTVKSAQSKGGASASVPAAADSTAKADADASSTAKTKKTATSTSAIPAKAR